MAAAFRIFYAVLLFSLIAKEISGCSLDSLQLSQAMTGVMVGRKIEYVVTVTNKCNCEQRNIKVSCNGFQTAENIDPSVFRQAGDGNCLLINGQPLGTNQLTNFKYAWDNQFPFTVVHAEGSC